MILWKDFKAVYANLITNVQLKLIHSAFLPMRNMFRFSDAGYFNRGIGRRILIKYIYFVVKNSKQNVDKIEQTFIVKSKREKIIFE